MFNPLLPLAGPKVKKTSGRLRAMELKGTMNGARRKQRKGKKTFQARRTWRLRSSTLYGKYKKMLMTVEDS